MKFEAGQKKHYWTNKKYYILQKNSFKKYNFFKIFYFTDSAILAKPSKYKRLHPPRLRSKRGLKPRL